MNEMTLALLAWDRADSALNEACSELAAVRGAASQWHALCKAAKRMQEEGRDLIEEAAAAFRACGASDD